MENKATGMIVENVKIDKSILWRPTFMKSGCDYLRNARIIAKRTRRNLFVFIVTTRT
jgi:hypothetical protein